MGKIGITESDYMELVDRKTADLLPPARGWGPWWPEPMRVWRAG